MALFWGRKNERGADDLAVKSIGACLVHKEDKIEYIVIAYCVENIVEFCAMEMPNGRKLIYDDFLKAIGQAEKVKHITYILNGERRDIYLCRETSGKIIDIVDRGGFYYNKYCAGFAEIATSQHKFFLKHDVEVPFDKKFSCEIEIGNKNYDVGSPQYAIINAYNACLLGMVFRREEFNFETKYKEHVCLEVRKDNSFFDERTLVIHPVENGTDNVLDYYETEEFKYNDGREVSVCAYRLNYMSRLRTYSLTRI